MELSIIVYNIWKISPWILGSVFCYLSSFKNYDLLFQYISFVTCYSSIFLSLIKD